MDKEKKTKA